MLLLLYLRIFKHRKKTGSYDKKRTDMGVGWS